MNKKELDEKLQQKGISRGSYSLEGNRYGECICLITEGDQYRVIYNSRGEIIEIENFTNEDEACEFIFNEIIKEYHGLK